MLQTLHIENIAVIRKTDIDFSSGFSVLSGETGAGKSILIDSIGFLLGRRAGRELLRTDADKALVSAIFADLSPETETKLQALGIEPDEEGALCLERTLSREGKTAARINGRPVNLSLIRAVGEVLVSIHGQSDTHTLTEKENQLAILDRYAENSALLADYCKIYEQWTRVRAEIREISAEEASRLRELEMLRYQIADIEALSLTVGEEEKLEEKKKRLKSMERIAKQSSFAYRALRAGEKSNVLYILDRAIAAVRSLSDVIPEAVALAEELLDCAERIEDAAERIGAFTDEEEADAEKLLDRVEARLSAIEKLRRKYGGSVAEILAFCQKAKERLDLLSNADERLAVLKKEEAVLLKDMKDRADTLTESRRVAGVQLSERVLSVLAFLDMPRVTFTVSVLPRPTEAGGGFTATGADAVEFLLAANPKDAPMPLSSVASGGELSRIMLALKSVISDRDGIDTVVYDEIDTGVSGKTARKIGIELLRSARGVQVFCVTHSAQIASLADAQYLIQKSLKDGRAETEVYLLDENGRINELSRILGGIEVTEAQRRAAWELYTERCQYREE